MTQVRILYRMRQFWRTLSIKNDKLKFEKALSVLSPAQRVLVTRMQPSEQNHAVTVFRRLLEQGENQPDLLVAALLHDVGKLRYRLSPLERALVVLVRAGLPKQARSWGELPYNEWESLPSWRKAFIVAEQHAGWGADLARQTGVSTLTEDLIRLHDQPHKPGVDEEQASLLHTLWLVDNDS